MKKRTIIIVVLLIFILRNTGYCQHIQYLLYEGFFDYARIEDACLYSPYRNETLGRSDYIKRMNLDKNSIPIIHYSSGSINVKLPYVWTKSGDDLFVAYFMHYKNKGSALINYRSFETRDSLQLMQTEKEWIKSHTISLSPLNDYNWALTMHRPNYLSDSTRESYINALSFDIAVNNNCLTFCLSDRDAFYIWNCKIPPKGERYAEWNQVAVYTSDYFQEEFIPRDESKSYDKQKEILNAIGDTLFFDGHFKMIEQEKERFIINRNHGDIYYLGEKKIEKVGKVLVSEDYPKIQGKRLFIEDRDNDEIIFFAPVIWEDTILPKLNIRILNEEEMREKFKYILE